MKGEIITETPAERNATQASMGNGTVTIPVRGNKEIRGEWNGTRQDTKMEVSQDKIKVVRINEGSNMTEIIIVNVHKGMKRQGAQSRKERGRKKDRQRIRKKI